MTSVLIVEDDARLRVELSLQLRDEGFEVKAVASAEEGLDRLTTEERDRFDLLLLDVRLPGQSGVELVRKLVELPDAEVGDDEAMIAEAAEAAEALGAERVPTMVEVVPQGEPVTGGGDPPGLG